MPRTPHFAEHAAGMVFRRHQRAQILESIRRHQSRCHQFPQASFNFCLEPSGRAHHVREEERSAPLQQFQHRPRHWTQDRRYRIVIFRMPRPHPVRIFAHKESNRRDSSWNHAPPPL